MDSVIKIEKLNKSFGSVHAVKDLSIEVRRGELFAFLGVNGAGKSTTISVLCGQLSKDSGSVTVCGQNVDGAFGEVSRRMGVVYQNSVLDQPLTVFENLESRGALYGIKGEGLKKRVAELARLLDFSDLLGRTVGKLSGGQRRRIDIARALLHSPEILILDEPTTGLDPQTRRLLWDVITSLRREQNMTVFLTTHYMEEAADADYIVILDSGSIAAQGTPLELKNRYTGDFITFYGAEKEDLQALGLPVTVIGDALRVEVPSTARARELMMKHPELFSDFEITKGKMDDVFLSATGKKLTGGNDR